MSKGAWAGLDPSSGLTLARSFKASVVVDCMVAEGLAEPIEQAYWEDYYPESHVCHLIDMKK